MSKWLKKGDKVAVVTGNEKGKSGKVLARRKNRVVVEGINLRKKHMRKTQENPQGQILAIEGSLHVSNVRACDSQGKPVKLRCRVNEQGERELIFHDGKKEVPYRSIKSGK